MKQFLFGFVILSFAMVAGMRVRAGVDEYLTYLPLVQRPFPFAKTATSPFYLQNFANNAGCNWLGIAGEVLDAAGQPVPPNTYQVHVWGGGIDNRVLVGSAPEYGPTGWEQYLFAAPVVRDYLMQLETSTGTAVSPIYPVQTRASCEENLVRFDFYQLP